MRIALCGSTRFEPLFHEYNHQLACAGHTVYSLSLFGREAKDSGKDGKKTITEDEKSTLDLVHLDKILNSDAIVVINPDGYVGFSTAREIQWAEIHGKKIYWHYQTNLSYMSAHTLRGRPKNYQNTTAGQNSS